MKKLLSFVLAIILIVAVVPFGAFEINTSAATKQDAVNWLKAQNGAWYDLDGAYGAQCSDFASAYMNWLVTGNPRSGTYGVYNANYYPTVASWNTGMWEVIANYYDFVPQPGDIFVTVGADANYGHVGAVISSTTTTATIIDQNYVNWNLQTGSNAVVHDITWSGAYAPTYYIRYKGFSSSSSPTYENIEQGTYGIKNNSTGTYLSVSYGIDQNEQNVDLYNELNVATKMIITKASTGYKIRPQCCASRIINPFGDTVRGGLNVNIYNDVNDSSQWWVFQKVSNGYVIRNVQNTNCVLDVNNGNVIVSNYTGATTQIWTLNNLTHTHSYGSWQVRKAPTCAATGIEFRVCSCGREETRTVAKLSTHTYNNSYDTKCNICGITRVIARYPDMSQNAWYTEAVGYVSKTGIMTGYSNGLFGVSDSIQRQDFLVMLARISGVNLNSYKYKSRFPDVARNSYYEAAVNWGVEKGIVTGYQNGKFGVGDKVTREQLVTFLYRYAKHKGYNYSYSSNRESAVSGQYKDYKNVSGFAKAPVLWAIEKGVISGKTSTTIAPHGNAQRCEVAQIMYNIYLKNIFR